MKNIYIAEYDGRRLGDIQQVLQKIDLSGEKYRQTVNPFDRENVGGVSLQDILDATNSTSLDLMILSLDIGGLPDMKFKDSPERYVDNLRSVQMALDYKRQGHRNPVILTMDGYYSGTFENFIIQAGEKGGEMDSLRDLSLVLHVFLDKDYLNLYSTSLPEKLKVRKFLNVLEGVPKIDVEIFDMGTGKLTTVEAEKGIFPEG